MANTIEEITEKTFTSKREESFLCNYLDNDSELYAKSTGMIAYIDDSSFVYLTHDNYSFDSIKIVLVEDDKETVFDVIT